VPVDRHTVCAGTLPAAAAQYDRDHKRQTGAQVREASRSRREVKPLNWLAIREGESDG
jgi:hypothetical protein